VNSVRFCESLTTFRKPLSDLKTFLFSSGIIWRHQPTIRAPRVQFLIFGAL